MEVKDDSLTQLVFEKQRSSQGPQVWVSKEAWTVFRTLLGPLNGKGPIPKACVCLQLKKVAPLLNLWFQTSNSWGLSHDTHSPEIGRMTRV